MNTSKQLNIGIIGAGITGLSCAFALLQQGHRITLIEKNEQLGELGAGIQLSPNATRILNEWHLLDEIHRYAFKPVGVQFSHWKNGKVIANFPLNHKTEQSPYLHIHRAHLHKVLLNAVTAFKEQKIILGEKLVDLKLANNICFAITENSAFIPKEYSFDYVLGCDGIHSQCRPFIEPKAKAEYTGNIAWRGLISVEKLTKAIEPKAHLIMAPGAHLVFYYVNGGKQLNFVAIKEEKQSSEESWTQKGSLKQLLNDFSNWHPDFLDILAKANEQELFKWALYDRKPLRSWHNHNLIIAGDAAHPVLPFLAQGAAMGIEDAYVLAQCLEQRHEFPETGLRFFELRQQRCTKVLEASRSNMKLYHDRNFIKRVIRDMGCRVFDRVYPEFLNNKLDWLYQYKP